MLGAITAQARREDRVLPEGRVEGEAGKLFEHCANRLGTGGETGPNLHPTQAKCREFVIGARFDFGPQTGERMPMNALEHVTIAPLLGALILRERICNTVRGA